MFFDLSVVSKCPRRLIAAAFADVVCRTTSQVDWLMSHLFFGTDYQDTAYTLLAYDEEPMMANAAKVVAGDFEALAMLTRIAAIMGLGTSFYGNNPFGLHGRAHDLPLYRHVRGRRTSRHFAR